MRCLCATIISVALLAGSSFGVAGQSDPLSRPAIPSTGCGTSEVGTGQLLGGMTVEGVHRSWLLDVPPAHDGSTPLPLVIQLHGATVHPPFMVETTRFDQLGKTAGFVVATPQGRGSTPYWLIDVEAREPDISRANPDIAFIDALIDQLADDLCLDLARVYATGHSAGGDLASALACTLADRIAATASVGAFIDFCDVSSPERPVPHLAFHGTADPTAPFEGGMDDSNIDEVGLVEGVSYSEWPVMSWPGWSVSVPDQGAAVAKRNGCTQEASAESLADGIERLSWSCPPGGETELVVIDGGGHGWPGSALNSIYEDLVGPVTMDIDATTMMWDFFEQHPRPE